MWVVHILAPTTALSSHHPSKSRQGAKFRPFLLVQEVANQRTFRGGNFDTRHTRPLIIASPTSIQLHTLTLQTSPTQSNDLLSQTHQIRFS